MPLNSLHAWAAIAGSLLLTSVVYSYGTGVWPGKAGTAGIVPVDVARKYPSCGQCHRLFAGGLSLAVSCVPTARSLTPSQSISVTTSATGGQTISTWGGFVCEATAGTFAAGVNSILAPTTQPIVTHVSAFNSNNRVWTYGYTAPAAPGLVQLYTAVNTVNGDGVATGEDFWGFHGYNSASNDCTPVRLYVNAAGVKPIGSSCVGGWGQFPVLGSKTAPAVPNAAFAVELHGAAASSQASLLIGANAAWAPFDLSVFGITGCTLYVDTLLAIGATTSAGDLFRGDGAATYPLPIPNDASLHGGVLQVQAAIFDAHASRPLKLTMTNGLSITIP